MSTISKNSHIQIHPLDIDGKTIQIPVFDLGFELEKTILITAGMDGDEYTGIEAAYQLIDYYLEKPLVGRLVIIPIVNISGFENFMSQNPIDNKFPKLVMGKKDGSSTEKLMDWLYGNYVSKCKLWIDLHSGALTEKINPFIWTYETSNKDLNISTEQILKHISSDQILYEKQSDFPKKIHFLEKNNIVNLVLESGEMGKRNKTDIERHITWVLEIVNAFLYQEPIKKQKTVFRKVNFYNATEKGLWFPNSSNENKENQTIGTLKSLENKIIKQYKLKNESHLLWWKHAMYTAKNELLFATATQIETV